MKALWYDIRGFFIFKLAYRASLRKQVEFFAKNISLRHLEVAIGSGTFFKLQLRRDWESHFFLDQQYFGIDIDEEMLESARKIKDPTIFIEKMNAEKMDSFGDWSLRSVNCANALHCMKHPTLVIREIYRVLEPGGTFAGNVLLWPDTDDHPVWGVISNAVNAWGIKNGLLNSPMSATNAYLLLINTGFKIVKTVYEGNVLNFVAVKPIELVDRPDVPL